MRENISVFRTALTGTYPPVEQAEVRRIQAPTLLITGERSHPAIIAVTKALAALLPNAQCVRIPGAAHNAHEDNPAAYNRAVLDFLAAQRPEPLNLRNQV
ncbi:MAG: alpha/beta fold hydrolase [Thermomicrobiales bacterium]